MYEISTTTFFASTLENLRNSLHFNSPSHLDKWTNSNSKSKPTGHVLEYVLKFQEKWENDLPWVAFRTAIITNPLV